MDQKEVDQRKIVIFQPQLVELLLSQQNVPGKSFLLLISLYHSESTRARTSIFTDVKARKKPTKKRTYPISMSITEDSDFNKELPKFKAKRMKLSTDQAEERK